LALLSAQTPALGAAQTAPPPRCDWSDYDDFCTPPDLGELTPGWLGKVLWVDHVRSYTPEEVAAAAGLPSSPYGAEAYRILYLSQAPAGTPRAVSGLIVVPTGPVPEEGFPVIAHGHGTTGLADVCAPSRRRQSVEGLLPWVAQGYLVSATDYVGLGTPGLHPYLVGEAEAFSMLDSARAALRFSDITRGMASPAANQIILGGHSQGGHAALFAHQAWQSYAPELNVLGTVAFAPASELRFLVQRMARRWSPLAGMGASAMYAYSEYYGVPDTPQTWLKEPYATELPDRIERQCALRIDLWLGFRPDQVFQPDLLAAIRDERWEDVQPWTDYMDANTPGNYSSDVPVLLLQGEDDHLIPPQASERLMERLCAHGTPVKLSCYAGVGHTEITEIGHSEALQWIADRLAGMPAPNDCPESLCRTSIPLPWR